MVIATYAREVKRDAAKRSSTESTNTANVPARSADTAKT